MNINGVVKDIQISKRDGRIVRFEPEKITFAIFKALRAVGKPDRQQAEDLMLDVLKQLELFDRVNYVPSVEEVQDMVEKVLFENNFFDVVKVYILYRKQHEALKNMSIWMIGE